MDGGQNVNKLKALSVLFRCAELYRDNLVGNNLLFVCSDKHLNVKMFPVAFLAGNFMHLTGVKFKGKAQSSVAFYNACLDKRLSAEDFEMATDGTTELKLRVLPALFKSNLSATMVGTYKGNRPKLETDRLAGGVKACMGFVFSQETQFYVPNTVLNEDVRDVTGSKLRIIATFRKMIDEERYYERVYMAKKVKWDHVKLPSEYSYLDIPTE